MLPGLVALVVFDGEGKLTADATISINGLAFPATATGTYTVDSNCKETISLSTGETLSGVIVDRGEEIDFMNATNGFLGAAGAIKKVKDSE